MFTPPSSPLPATLKFFDGTPPSPELAPSLPTSTSSRHPMAPGSSLPSPPLQHGACGKSSGTSMLVIRNHKHRIAWRTTLTVIMVPLTLVLLTFAPRLVLRPLFADVPSPDIHFAGRVNWNSHTAHVLHRRQNGPTITVSSSASSQASDASVIVFPSSTPTTAQNDTRGVPTIPSSPTLPTPFPQPFDTTLSSNFTTNTCALSFTNMTQSLPFRQCRPFSLLSQTSSDFLRVSCSGVSPPAISLLILMLIDSFPIHKVGTVQPYSVEYRHLGHM
jgi:hypothetical protein